MHEDVQIFKCAFKIYSIWLQAHKYVTNTLLQCSPTSVGLAQARPNYCFLYTCTWKLWRQNIGQGSPGKAALAKHIIAWAASTTAKIYAHKFLSTLCQLSVMPGSPQLTWLGHILVQVTLETKVLLPQLEWDCHLALERLGINKEHTPMYYHTEITTYIFIHVCMNYKSHFPQWGNCIFQLASHICDLLSENLALLHKCWVWGDFIWTSHFPAKLRLLQ